MRKEGEYSLKICLKANKLHKIHKCVKYQCNTTFMFIQICKYKYKNTTAHNIRQIIIEYQAFCVGFNETSWLRCRHNSQIESHFFISNLLIMIFFNKNTDLCVRICIHVHTHIYMMGLYHAVFLISTVILMSMFDI